MTAKRVQVLIGMIASGKTTYSKLAARNGYICMNDDAIVEMLHGTDYTLYRKELKPLYKLIENTIINTALAMERSVVIDRGLNISKDSRRRWIALADSLDVYKEAVVFPRRSPDIHATRRTNSDSREYGYEYWLKVASTHNNQWQDPTISEGFDSIRYVTWSEIEDNNIEF
jgi:shikimate kinase